MPRLAYKISCAGSRRIAVLVATLCLAGPVLAQQQQPIVRRPLQRSVGDIPDLPTDQDLAFVTVDPALAELVALLDDAMFAAREQAMQRLLGGPVDRSQICKMLLSTELSLEQRHRLLALLRHDLLNAPRGAIGIMIDQRKRPNIIIEQLIENLPAIEVLEPGDRITHFDGKPAPTWASFRKSILSKKPGDIISITIERLPQNAPGDAPDNVPDDALDEVEDVQRQTFNFELTLGSADRLDDPVAGQVQATLTLDNRSRDANQAVDRFAPQPRLIEFRPHAAAEAKPESPTQHGSESLPR